MLRTPPVDHEATKDRLHGLLVERCETDPLTGCCIYTGAWNRHGQGVVKVKSRTYLVSRVAAWVYLGGFDLPDMTVKVRHRRGCPHPACFAVDHLRVVPAGQTTAAAG
jgi:hypothetical protein